MFKKENDYILFVSIIKDILDNEEFKKLKEYRHHFATTRYQHCLNVAYCSFVFAKRLKNPHIEEIVRGALLHDFFLYEWRKVGHRKDLGVLKGFHAFYHPYISLENSEEYFELTSREKDIIKSHMFPCYFGIPKYKESFIIILTDKWCSLEEGILKKNPYKMKEFAYI